VDAIDEDGRRGTGDTLRILQELKKLSSEQMSRLCFIGFARSGEVPDDVTGELAETFKKQNPTWVGGLNVELALLDAKSASDLLGGSNALRHVVELIRANRLESVAPYPAVLLRLRTHRPDDTVSDISLWHEVLIELLKERRWSDREDPNALSAEERFEGAARIAAAVTFSGLEYFDSGRAFSTDPTIDDIVRLGTPELAKLRRSAKAAIRTAVFRSDSHGYAFAQQHTREWFTAFELKRFSLGQVRPLLSDGEGHPIAAHRGLMGILYRTSDHNEVRDWIRSIHGGIAPRSDAAPWSLTDAVSALDHLQTLSKTTAWHLRVDRGLQYLSTRGIDEVLADRLDRPTISKNEKELILDVARATKARGVLPSLSRLMEDTNADGQLRLSAAHTFTYLASDSDIRDKAIFVRAAVNADGPTRAVANVLCYTLLYRKIFNALDVAKYGPPIESDEGDSSGVLLFVVARDLTIEDARQILDDPAIIDRAQLVVSTAKNDYHRARGLPHIVETAIERLASQPKLDPADYDRLLPFALTGHDGWRAQMQMEVNRAFERDQAARQKLFMAGITSTSKESNPQTWMFVLQAEDAEWLFRVAETENVAHPWLWDAVLRLSHWRPVESSLKDKIRDRVAEVNPQLLVEFNKAQLQRAEDMERYSIAEEKLKKERAVHELSISKVVEQILQGHATVINRMHTLSWVCFAESSSRPTNVSGTINDLSPTLHEAVFDFCEKALNECEPTPLPNENSYPTAIRHEGACFKAVIEQRRPTFQLKSSLISKWLPACFLLSGSDREFVIESCIAVDQAATEDLIVKEVKRELNTSLKVAYVAENLAGQFWNERLSRAFGMLLEDDQLNIDGRVGLARLLAVTSPSTVLPILETWAKAKVGDPLALRKRTTAIDILLAIAPDKIWDVFVEEAKARGRELIEQMASLRAGLGNSARVNIRVWPANRIAEFSELLETYFPLSSAPQRNSGEVFSPTADDELHDLRGSLPILLADRGTTDDIQALEQLAIKYPQIDKWWRHQKATQTAEHFIESVGSPRSMLAPEVRIPIDRVVRFLEDGEYRLIRTNEDLQAVIFEQLVCVAKDARDHLSMLYTPRKKPSQKRLEEDALQAYLLCRLRDRLPNRVLERETLIAFIDREPLASADQRLDLKIQAPTISGGRATVIIEVKWSDNPDCATSLQGQLGKRYLIDDGETHGIYFVGWCGPGSWAKAGGPRPEPFDQISAWQARFNSQAAEFQKLFPNTSVIPLVVDLRW